MPYEISFRIFKNLCSMKLPLKHVLTALVTIWWNFSVDQSTSGGILGFVYDSETCQPIPFVNVVIENGGQQITGGTTDFQGVFKFQVLHRAETYKIKASTPNYITSIIDSVVIKPRHMLMVEFQLDTGLSNSEPTKERLESHDYLTRTLAANLFKPKPHTRCVTDNDGAVGSIKGTRTGSADTYIDGVKVRGAGEMPKAALEQPQPVLIGTPAAFEKSGIPSDTLNHH